VGATVALQQRPSSYFRRQCYISCDPDERTIPALAELYGADRFFWASDYPHPDHTPDYLREVDGLAERLSPAARLALLGASVRQAYGLS
jgi:predicted TIM-barrel fold metal-dependent hydrolase